MRDKHLQTVIDAAGGQAALARALGISRSTVAGWLQVPTRHTPAVARLTGLSMSRLRPDVFTQHSAVGFSEAQAPFQAEALALGLDADAIAAKALRDAVQAEKERRWLAENAAAIEAHNAWVEEHGVPLSRYRMF